MQPFLYLSLAAAVTAAVITPPVYKGKATVPDIQILPTWNRKDAIVKKIRYGPFKLPAATMKNGEVIANRIAPIIPLATKPCNECMVLMMAARAEFADGSEATDPGTYLHHAAIVNSGPGVTDGNCNKPGIDMFFSTGNEKSTVIFTNPNATMDAGYYLNPGHILIAQTEILNQEPIEKDVWVAYSFEYVDGKQPGWTHTRTVWISADMGTCDGSKFSVGLTPDVGNIAAPNNKAFNMTSVDWVSPYDGTIIACGGHMHNGGVNTLVFHNDELICDSKATYAAGSAMNTADRRAVSKRDSGMDMYLSSMSGCVMPGEVKKGDKMRMSAFYDFEAHPGMKNADGSLAPIMAVATCFITAKQ